MLLTCLRRCCPALLVIATTALAAPAQPAPTSLCNDGMIEARIRELGFAISETLVDSTACSRHADAARDRLDKRLKKENAHR